MLMAGGGLQAIGDISQGQTTSSVLNQQANIQMQNAANAKAAAALNANRQSIMAQKTLGGIQANFGASGVEGNSGSVLDVVAASASNAELDRQNILYGGEIKAINSENQASMDRFEASQAVSAGYLNAVAGVLTAGGKLYGSSLGAAGGATDSAAMAKGEAEVYGGDGEDEALDATGGGADLAEAAAIA